MAREFIGGWSFYAVEFVLFQANQFDLQKYC